MSQAVLPSKGHKLDIKRVEAFENPIAGNQPQDWGKPKTVKYKNKETQNGRSQSNQSNGWKIALGGNLESQLSS